MNNNAHANTNSTERKPAEVMTVPHDADEVKCDGGLDSLGHPQVWYRFDGNDQVSCHYCGRKFVKMTEK